VVLKAGCPGPELDAEIAALRRFDGRGSVRLLDASAEMGALLLEHLQPGTPLTAFEDQDHAVAIAAEVLRQLWRPLPPAHTFPSIGDWAAGLGALRRHFSGGTGPLPARLVEEAERLFAELIPTMAAPVLLHGDLHLDNILAAERQPWLAVDPKGVAGEPACDLWPLLSSAATPTGLRRCLDQLAAELSLDRRRICDWALAQSVLAGWWSVEDHGVVWEQAIACAEALSDLRP
jgi:streptomycin 6-kinase